MKNENTVENNRNVWYTVSENKMISQLDLPHHCVNLRNEYLTLNEMILEREGCIVKIKPDQIPYFYLFHKKIYSKAKEQEAAI